MKKSNKTSFLYILSSLSLFLLLVFGGCYGIYMSVGLSFVRQGVSNITNGGATNVSFGGSVNFQSSMLGVIVLSVALIVIAVIDFISLIKQIVFFKQFGIVRDSEIVKNIEKKTNGKGKIVFFAVMVDILSFIVGIIGIFVNMRTFPAGGMIWMIYVIDGLISILAVVSIVLLMAKLKMLNKNESDNVNCKKRNKNNNSKKEDYDDKNVDNSELNLNDIEYKLLKLKQLKTARILTKEEYEGLRRRVILKENIDIDNLDIDNENRSLSNSTK